MYVVTVFRSGTCVESLILSREEARVNVHGLRYQYPRSAGYRIEITRYDA